ncbi:MAG: PEP-CTERM sorting domain-containing protein [Planctomycetes bacterium]|nr:PEP-CTERM sorting domain-containing protein [Planctomycetota bacterium]
MRKTIFVAALVLALAPLAVSADTILSYTPDPADMGDLDHYYVYEWGIEVELEPHESIDAAELYFYNIRNWDDNANMLYNHLLNWSELGVVQSPDNQGGGDYFAGEYVGDHAHLVTYENLPSTPQNLTYAFSGADLATLNGYLADGRVGLGLDPDCHFYNDGVELRLTVVPEPASLALLAAGTLALLRRWW